MDFSNLSEFAQQWLVILAVIAGSFLVGLGTEMALIPQHPLVQ
jgi:hypothetical protein